MLDGETSMLYETYVYSDLFLRNLATALGISAQRCLAIGCVQLYSMKLQVGLSNAILDTIITLYSSFQEGRLLSLVFFEIALPLLLSAFPRQKDTQAPILQPTLIHSSNTKTILGAVLLASLAGSWIHLHPRMDNQPYPSPICKHRKRHRPKQSKQRLAVAIQMLEHG